MIRQVHSVKFLVKVYPSTSGPATAGAKASVKPGPVSSTDPTVAVSALKTVVQGETSYTTFDWLGGPVTLTPGEYHVILDHIEGLEFKLPYTRNCSGMLDCRFDGVFGQWKHCSSNNSGGISARRDTRTDHEATNRLSKGRWYIFAGWES
jgi:hypothetical protein